LKPFRRQGKTESVFEGRIRVLVQDTAILGLLLFKQPTEVRFKWRTKQEIAQGIVYPEIAQLQWRHETGERQEFVIK